MFFLYESDSDFDDASSSFDEYDFPSSTRGKYEEVLVGNVSNSHSDDSSEWDGPIIEELPSDSAADSEEQDTKATNWARSPSAEGRGAPENSTEKDESANAQTKLETERQSKKGHAKMDANDVIDDLNDGQLELGHDDEKRRKQEVTRRTLCGRYQESSSPG